MASYNDHNSAGRPGASEAEQADAYARMMEETLLDIEEIDLEQFPPDRRFILKDKEAWIYEHGNVCELVYVRVR